MHSLLIADDEETVRLLVAAILEDEYEVLQAVDGNQAWDLLLERQPDIALLDVSMPGLNGLQLAEAISGEPALRATKVVLLTIMDPLDLEAQRSPASPGQSSTRIDLYVQKPFTPSSLRSVLKTLG